MASPSGGPTSEKTGRKPSKPLGCGSSTTPGSVLFPFSQGTSRAGLLKFLRERDPSCGRSNRDRPKQMPVAHSPHVDHVAAGLGVQLSAQARGVGVEGPGTAERPKAPHVP